MGQNRVRLLKADEIECRVGTVSEKGLSLMLYKDARADMRILDETFGPMNWQRRHELVGGSLYCTVSVWDDEKKQWICKMDVGTESHTEKEKGQASDSFKRACVTLGIGRELYTAPFIWVSASKVRIENRGGKPVACDRFKVMAISYNDNGEIRGLEIAGQDGKTVYSLKDKGTAQGQDGRNVSGGMPAEETDPAAADKVMGITKELARTGVALESVLKRYGVGSIQEMTDETYRKAMNGLKRTKAKEE